MRNGEKEDRFSVETRNLVKRFGKFTAVDDLDLKVKRGEIYGLLGPNGAGKTTTIKILCGLLKVSSGDCYVLGEKIPSRRAAFRIGYIPQETALYPGLSVHQNIQFFGGVFGLSRKKIGERESELLRFINLEEWDRELVENLSGGMKHRVSLACSMIHQPQLLFLDEPTVGVDPELRASFWEYFDQLKQSGVTILITTHYMDEASHCDRIGFMRRGRLIAEGRPEKILEIAGTSNLEDAFMVFSRRGGEP
ncbi:MAG: ABC transporter ATP-binding protein [Actinomycetota bacterium]|nr:ABC transporter ATP-binding protein [Actinomycetota bacterium]